MPNIVFNHWLVQIPKFARRIILKTPLTCLAQSFYLTLTKRSFSLPIGSFNQKAT